MSVYTFLSMPVPTIAYCALHQAAPDVTRDDYVGTMREFHDRLRHESAKLSSAYGRYVEELVGKELHTLRTSITEFLQTPLRLDEGEVQKRVQESFGRLGETLGEHQMPPLIRSVEGEVIDYSSKDPMEKRLLTTGRSYLTEIGFTPGKANIFESVFVVRGGQSLDLLEHLVRDVLGIYATTHGKHIKEFDKYAYTAYNLVLEQLAPSEREDRVSGLEGSFFFSKPSPEVIKYAPFRSALSLTMEELIRNVPVKRLSVWQRKLGLGAGVEFVARVVCDHEDQLNASIRFLGSLEEKSLVREVLLGQARLVVKRILF
jgi:hypothetical protein